MPAIRYITRGFIDGSLSTLGIVLGAAVGGDPRVIIAAGLGGGMANAISNLLGALTAEKAGVMLELRRYERAMVGSKVKLKDTHIYDKRKKEIWKAGTYDGLTTFVGSVVPVIPFAVLGLSDAVMASIAITVGLLFLLGVYLGKLSKDNIVFAGVKMAIFGLVTAGLAMSLEFFFS
jgi:predicted membrane protein (TIGR00267 family)